MIRVFEACPFAPGELKPDSIYVAPGHNRDHRKTLTRKIVFIVVAMVGLAFLYSYIYSDFSLTGEPMLYWDDFVFSLGVYTYLSFMVAFFIKQHKRKMKRGDN